MTNGSDERILVERVFDLGLPVDTVWALLAQVEQWPEWAPHIRRARLDGEGTLGPESQGQFQFWPAGSGRVHMTTWEPPHLWTWRGRVVGLPIIYHHHFEALPGPMTRLRWVVELAEGRRGPRARDCPTVCVTGRDLRVRDWVSRAGEDHDRDHNFF